MRREAIEVLGEGDPLSPRVITALQAALGDPVWEVRVRAAQVLAGNGSEDEAVVRILLEEAETADADARARAIWALRKNRRPGESAIRIVEGALADVAEDVRAYAAATLMRWQSFPPTLGPVLREMLASTETWRRMTALVGLGAMPAEARQVRALIQEALSDPEPDVRREALVLWKKLNLEGRPDRDTTR